MNASSRDSLEEVAAQFRPTIHDDGSLNGKPGDMIGRYKLLQQIGEGGCGVVYMAEQTEPVRRRVALKIIKLGMDTKSVIARFEAERQALAMMDHPNIAKVFDAGATKTGRPYFVMELVRGMKITEYCDEKRLSTPERLDLFIQVCQAIQHAHQKGIIHRDIKPSNILVTINDGVAVPKVIDFGVAKATSGQQLTDKTLFTAFEQFIGTPAYMSPEQAVLTSLDIDTRSDIYALGVLLYELLTGRTPFDAKELLAIGLDEMRRTIREQEPPRPSTRLSTLGQNELNTTAQHRGLEAPELVSELRGDLDWIVMKCIEKDRARRYETANDLASDIQRHGSHEPVVACPPGRLYRLQKMVRRNRLAFAAAAAVVAALISGLGISTWLFLKERAARTRAVASEQAERQLRREAELRELNEHAYVVAWQSAGAERAIAARKQALEAQRKLLGNDHPEVAESLEHLAGLLRNLKDYAEAEKTGREALAIRRKNSPDGDHKLADSLLYFTSILGAQNRWSEIEEVCRETLQLRRRLQENESGAVLEAINELAGALGHQKKLAEALPLFKEAFSIARKMHPDEHQELAMVGGNVLLALVQLDKLTEAADFARDFVPRNAEEKRLMDLVDRLALLLLNQGKTGEMNALLTDLVSKAPESRRLLRIRAWYRACQGMWQGAAADLSAVIQQKWGKQGVTLFYDNDWHRMASLLVQCGDLAGYREHCRKALQRFGQTQDVEMAYHLAKDCLILPDSGADFTILNRLADVPIAGKKQEGKYLFTKALAEYRQGRFASAAEWAEKALAAEEKPGCVTVQASATLAMARHQLKQSDPAQVALAKAEDVAKNELPALDSGKLGRDWFNVIIANTLMREAKALIEGSAVTRAETK